MEDMFRIEMDKKASLLNNDELLAEHKKAVKERDITKKMCIHFLNFDYKKNSMYKRKCKRVEEIEEELKKRGIYE